MIYRKKQVIIEARQLRRDNIKEIFEWVYGAEVTLDTDTWCHIWELFESSVITEGLIISTLEGGKFGRAKHIASIGDYIIKGVTGEFYSCKPDIFTWCYRHELEEMGHLSDDYEVIQFDSPESYCFPEVNE